MGRFLFLLLFFSQMVLAQTDVKFNKTEYYFADSSKSAMIINSALSIGHEKYFAVTGNTDSTYYNLFILKTDEYGILIDVIDLGSDSIAFPTYPGNTIITDNDSNIIACSNNWYYKSNGSWDGYIIKLNQNLDTLWTRVYSLPPILAGCPPDTNVINYLTAIKQTLDGGYIVTGNYTMNCTPGNQRSYLLKLDKDGNIEWRKVYQDVKDLFNIEINNDSGFIFIDYSLGFAINKTDNLGNIEWKKDPNSLWHLTSGDLCVSGNEIIAACPYMYNNDFNNPYFGLDIVRLDAGGGIIWNKQYILFQTFECSGIHQDFEVESLPNGDILICGTARVLNQDTSAGGYKGVLFRLNSDGDSLWARHYNYGNFNDDCQFNDVVLTDDGGFLAVGYHFPYDGSYNAGAWLVKTDSNGYAPGSFPTSIEKPQPMMSNFNIYPNPAIDQAWIDLDKLQPNHSGGYATLVDNAGRVVLQISFGNNAPRLHIKTSHLPAGLYFVRVVFKSGEGGVSKLMVR